MIPIHALRARLCFVSTVLLIAWAGPTGAAAQPAADREFPPGALQRLEDLPASRLRTQLENLPGPARDRALAWLRSVHFTGRDLNTLRADADGGIYYADTFAFEPFAAPGEPAPEVAAAALPVSPFPASLVFHSRPGAPNVLYLNFTGENVVNTAWNTSVGRSTIPAVAFSTDADATTFSDAEQAAIKQIWQRVAEDYAPFDIDVTTERPGSFGTRTAHALITRTTDANGQANPDSGGGGVAYVNVFANANYATYRPAWIYFNNLANDESFIAEAASHEIGHNLGLSHDGLKNGTEYYGGHGSGDTSWGPIMGTGYHRNVSQWSKGEYYQASNTQDDLATMAAKLTYRPDDHGNTPAAATALTITQGTNVTATTPANDPANTIPANKGILERTADVDVFSFVTGNGPVNLAVNPWIMPSARTRGGNLDLVAELYNAAGALLLTNNPADGTHARIQTTLTEGLYFLRIRNTGVGTPTNSQPSGYTPYASLGQYFVTGTVVSSSVEIPPQAELAVTDITLPGVGTKPFTVTYRDDTAIATGTIDGNDVRVTGPRGYDRAARLVALDVSSDGTPRVATYAVDPVGGGGWTGSDNGTYTVWMQSNAVSDTDGMWVTAGQLGQFSVNVPTFLYYADMTTNPGWTLEPLWAYGPPAYPAGGPSSGFTGPNILAYNLAGNYENRLAPKYATTPPINCAGASSLTLRFRRWLRLRNGDTALIQVSTNGTAWTEVWSTTKPVADNGWQEVQYALPAWAAGSSALRLRWGLSSGPAQNDIGWNLDDVEILAGGTLDTTLPVAALSAADLTVGGSPTHSFTVTYTDDSAIRIASLGATDVLVTGPNGFSNLVEFVGVDTPMDGTPRTAAYAIAAPGGTWDAADNGIYELVLLDAEVTDVFNNALNETPLGSFRVAIPATPNVTLAVTANVPAWGTVSPNGGVYAAGSAVPLTATPAAYFRFVEWTGAATGTNNPLTVVLSSNLTIVAVFAELMTTNHPTPHWWLAANRVDGDFETAVDTVGANGLALWQSYIAGLNPNDPASQLRLLVERANDGGGCVLQWQTVTGRVYSVWGSANSSGGFRVLPGASNLPHTVQRFTNGFDPLNAYFRLGVEKR